MLPTHKAIGLLVGCTLLFSGCLGTKPVTPTRFYVLNPTHFQETLVNGLDTAEIPAVEIIPVRLPQYLEKPQIVTRTGSNRLKLAEYHQWGGNLRKNINRVLAQNMASLLDTPHVSIAPYTSALPSKYRVEIEIMQFERDADGFVRLRALWRIARGTGKRILSSRLADLKSPGEKSAEGYARTVSAMEDLLGDLSRAIAGQIVQHALEDRAE